MRKRQIKKRWTKEYRAQCKKYLAHILPILFPDKDLEWVRATSRMLLRGGQLVHVDPDKCIVGRGATFRRFKNIARARPWAEKRGITL